MKTKPALAQPLNVHIAEPNRTTSRTTLAPRTAHHLATKNRFNVLQTRVEASDSSLLQAWRAAHVQPASSSASESVSPIEEPPARTVPVTVPVLVVPATPDISSASESEEDNVQQSPQHVQEDVVQAHDEHPMTTRSRAGIVKPNPRYAFITVKEDYAEPKSLKAALRHPGWNGAMGTEIDNMVETETFELSKMKIKPALAQPLNVHIAEPNRTTSRTTLAPRTAHHLATKNRFNVLQTRVEVH
ncbi:hypothetical protein YC2023_090628 [Brassica napus]